MPLDAERPRGGGGDVELDPEAAAREMENLEKSAESLVRTFRSVSQVVEVVEKATSGLSDASKDAAVSDEDFRKQMGQTEKQLQALSNVLGGEVRGLSEVESAFNRASDGISNHKAMLESVAKSSEEVADSEDELSDSLLGQADAADTAGSALGRLKDEMGGTEAAEKELQQVLDSGSDSWKEWHSGAKVGIVDYAALGLAVKELSDTVSGFTGSIVQSNLTSAKHTVHVSSMAMAHSHLGGSVERTAKQLESMRKGLGVNREMFMSMAPAFEKGFDMGSSVAQMEELSGLFLDTFGDEGVSRLQGFMEQLERMPGLLDQIRNIELNVDTADLDEAMFALAQAGQIDVGLAAIEAIGGPTPGKAIDKGAEVMREQQKANAFLENISLTMSDLAGSIVTPTVGAISQGAVSTVGAIGSTIFFIKSLKRYLETVSQPTADMINRKATNQLRLLERRQVPAIEKMARSSTAGGFVPGARAGGRRGRGRAGRAGRAGDLVANAAMAASLTEGVAGETAIGGAASGAMDVAMMGLLAADVGIMGAGAAKRFFPKAAGKVGGWAKGGARLAKGVGRGALRGAPGALKMAGSGAIGAVAEIGSHYLAESEMMAERVRGRGAIRGGGILAGAAGAAGTGAMIGGGIGTFLGGPVGTGIGAALGATAAAAGTLALSLTGAEKAVMELVSPEVAREERDRRQALTESIEAERKEVKRRQRSYLEMNMAMKMAENAMKDLRIAFHDMQIQSAETAIALGQITGASLADFVKNLDKAGKAAGKTLAIRLEGLAGAERRAFKIQDAGARRQVIEQITVNRLEAEKAYLEQTSFIGKAGEAGAVQKAAARREFVGARAGMERAAQTGVGGQAVAEARAEMAEWVELQKALTEAAVKEIEARENLDRKAMERLKKDLTGDAASRIVEQVENFSGYLDKELASSVGAVARVLRSSGEDVGEVMKDLAEVVPGAAKLLADRIEESKKKIGEISKEKLRLDDIQEVMGGGIEAIQEQLDKVVAERVKLEEQDVRKNVDRITQLMKEEEQQREKLSRLRGVGKVEVDPAHLKRVTGEFEQERERLRTLEGVRETVTGAGEYEVPAKSAEMSRIREQIEKMGGYNKAIESAVGGFEAVFQDADILRAEDQLRNVEAMIAARGEAGLTEEELNTLTSKQVEIAQLRLKKLREGEVVGQEWLKTMGGVVKADLKALEERAKLGDEEAQAGAERLRQVLSNIRPAQEKMLRERSVLYLQEIRNIQEQREGINREMMREQRIGMAGLGAAEARGGVLGMGGSIDALTANGVEQLNMQQQMLGAQERTVKAQLDLIEVERSLVEGELEELNKKLLTAEGSDRKRIQREIAGSNAILAAGRTEEDVKNLELQSAKDETLRGVLEGVQALRDNISRSGIFVVAAVEKERGDLISELGTLRGYTGSQMRDASNLAVKASEMELMSLEANFDKLVKASEGQLDAEIAKLAEGDPKRELLEIQKGLVPIRLLNMLTEKQTNLLRAKFDRVEKALEPRQRRLDFEVNMLSIEQDLANTIQAPFNVQFELQQRMVALRQRELDLARDRMAEVEKIVQEEGLNRANSEQYMQAVLNFRQKEVELVKSSIAAQRDFVDKALSKLIGEVSGTTFLQAPTFRDLWGSGAVLNEAGLVIGKGAQKLDDMAGKLQMTLALPGEEGLLEEARKKAATGGDVAKVEDGVKDVAGVNREGFGRVGDQLGGIHEVLKRIAGEAGGGGAGKAGGAGGGMLPGGGNLADLAGAAAAGDGGAPPPMARGGGVRGILQRFGMGRAAARLGVEGAVAGAIRGKDGGGDPAEPKKAARDRVAEIDARIEAIKQQRRENLVDRRRVPLMGGGRRVHRPVDRARLLRQARKENAVIERLERQKEALLEKRKRRPEVPAAAAAAPAAGAGGVEEQVRREMRMGMKVGPAEFGGKRMGAEDVWRNILFRGRGGIGPVEYGGKKLEPWETQGMTGGMRGPSGIGPASFGGRQVPAGAPTAAVAPGVTPGAVGAEEEEALSVTNVLRIEGLTESFVAKVEQVSETTTERVLREKNVVTLT